jgi:fructokinase
VSVPGLRIGIDLGGTKIEAIGLDVSGAERARRRVGTPRDDYGGTLAAIAGLVLGIEGELGARGSVGIGMPGAISPSSGLVKNANSTWLNGRDLRGDLKRMLARPLRFANDANCLALSEASDGAGAGAECVFGVILGTGTGGGVVLHGRPLTGPNAIAGEWGHNPLPWPEADEWPGPECYCGKRGCIETFTSGPALVADHARRSGERLEPDAIDARAQAGDAGCEATLARHESRLARGLASVVNLLDPDVIVLGGGLSNLARLYRNVPPLLARWAFTDTLSTRIAPPRHGDSSGVRGAAWLWDGAPEEE